MNCAYHVDVESVGYCVNCGRALCQECKRDVEGSVYCQACLADFIRSPAGAGVSKEHRPSGGGDNPGAAFVLGLIPGVGAIYNGEFLKAVVHLVVFGFLIGLTGLRGIGPFDVLFVLLSIGFYFYMPFDAYYTAKKRSLRNEGIDLETPIDRFNEQLQQMENKELWGGVALIGLGLLALMDNFRWLEIRALVAFWPVALIAAGVWLVLGYQEKRPKSAAPGPGPARDPVPDSARGPVQDPVQGPAEGEDKR